MLPKQLTIQGLYSYQEKQTIDFSKLTEAGIFGIFGAVGSGKSSILEAIGFALYGKTERLNDRENRNYNMMNLKSNELLIDFEFEHYDHSIYRFTVKGRRNSRRFQDVKTFERNAYKLENEKWIPLESADASNILDLSYDNFRRTIIIPQGRFQEFLQLGNSDRTRMMMDIFHLEKYDLSDKVRTLETENELNISNLQGQITSIGNSNKEDLLAKQEELISLQSKEKALKCSIEKNEGELQNSNKIKEQFDLLLQYQSNYTILENEKEKFQERKKNIEKFQQAKLYFEPSLNRKKNLQTSIENRNAFLQLSNTRSVQLDTDLESKKQTWETVQNDYTQLEKWQQQIQDILIVQDILDYQQQAKETETKIAIGKEHIDKEEKNKNLFIEKCNQLEENIRLKKSNQPANIFVYGEIGEWFQYKKVLQKQIAEVQQVITIQQERIANGKALFPTLSFNFENWQQESEQQKAQYKSTINEQQEEKSKFALTIELHQYAQNMEEGKPCPLCGAIHHPNILESDTAIAEKQKAIDNILLENSQALSLLESNISKATRYATEINSCEEQINIQSEIIKKTQQSLQLHEQKFSWNGFDSNDENTFVSLRQQAEKNAKEINELEEKLSEQKKQLDNIKETINKYQNALTERQTQYQSAIDNIQTLSNRLQLISSNDISLYSKEKCLQTKTTLEVKISYTKKQYENLQKQLQELDKNKAILTAEIQAAQSEKEKENNELEIILAEIQQLLGKHNITSEESVWKILQQNIDLPKENAAIQQYENQLFAAEQKLEQQAILLKDKTFDEEKWKLLYTELQTDKASLSNYTAVIAQLVQSIEQLHTSIENRKKLEKTLHEKTLRKDNIQTLKNLFSGSGFVNYISSVYLKNLCVAANERFSKLTHNQLHLELNENNEFLIRDLLNEGKTRSAKTLSGGQTFQASLSLALALADSVQYQNKSEQNFFFLDEGFGSLDKDALSTIFDTLKSLRKENRIIGIISHVEELQQEIPLSLFIENDAETGSHIHLQMS